MKEKNRRLIQRITLPLGIIIILIPFVLGILGDVNIRRSLFMFLIGCICLLIYTLLIKTDEEIAVEKEEERRRKISETMTGRKLSPEHIENTRKGSIGKKMSEESKQKNREAHLGVLPSEETKEKMREAHIGLIPDKKARMSMSLAHLGIRPSEEVRKKLSLKKEEYFKTHPGTMLGKKHSKKTRKKMREIRIEYIKEYGGGKLGDYFINIGRQEKPILDKLESYFGCKFIRQYFVDMAFVDGYCPELNLVVEVDEPYHYKNGVLREEDVIRQQKVIDELGCNFIRIKTKEFAQILGDN